MIRRNVTEILPAKLLILVVVLPLLLVAMGCSSDDDDDSNPTGTTTTLTVTNIAPNSVSTFGGTTVTINGTGFVNPTVTFGGTAGTNLTNVTGTSFNVVTPVHTAGTFSVVVTNSDSTAITVANGITFVAPLTLEKVRWRVDIIYLGGSFSIDADLIQNGNVLTGDFLYSFSGGNYQVLTNGMVNGDSIDVTFTLDQGMVNEASFRCIGQLTGTSPQTFGGDFTELIGDGFICSGLTTPCLGTFEIR